MKYMSVITNFGCHYKCPYCIVKENNLHIPKTTVAGLDNLREALKVNGCNIISISGGGDPLHEYDKHIEWYRKFFGITKSHRVYFDDREQSIPVEMHTSYMTDETSFPFIEIMKNALRCKNPFFVSFLTFEICSTSVRIVLHFLCKFRLQLFVFPLLHTCTSFSKSRYRVLTWFSA